MRFIRGGPGSGKTALVFREFATAVHTGQKNARILVPTATLVRHYQHELARSGLVFDPNMVMSLTRFACDCAPGLKLVPDGLLRALVRDALTRLQVQEFAQVAETRGMTDVVFETIKLFENAGCAPERLAKVRTLSPHGKAFLRVWDDVDAAVKARQFATRGHIMRQAGNAVPAGPLWIDGFLKFSRLEDDFIQAIDAKCDLALTESTAADEIHRRPQIIAVKAASPQREADEIASRIIELHERGTEFPGIAVALRDADNWLPLLRTTFDRFGIPARYYFSTPVKTHPVAVFLGGLIECALADWDFERTLSTLRAHPVLGRRAPFDAFDFRVRDAMPGRGAEALLALCENEALRSDIADCLKVDSWRTERVRPAAWQQRLENLAESLYRVRTIPEPADFAAIETARSHAAGLQAWAAALEAAANFWTPDEPISLEQFHQVVSEELETATMQVPDNRHNVVHVMSAFEARQWQVKALFVCGMTARDYPRRASQNLLFPDADLERLRSFGIPLRTAADEDKDEEMLFDSLKTRASEMLILSASAHDSSGKTIVPSQHFAEVAEVEQASACAPAPRTSAPEPGIAGLIGAASLARLAEQHRRVRLTALEDLAKCRFRFFSNHSLTLQGIPEQPSERIQARTRGLIFHKAMEHWLTDQTRDFVDIFERTFVEHCEKNNIPKGYSLEVERIESRRIARQIDGSVRWPAVRSEMEVDCSLEFPDGVTVTCRVDRIDYLEDGTCRIIDYKSGKVANVEKLVESKTSLQGPLYALAVRQKTQSNPVAMVFVAIREGSVFGWGDIPNPGPNVYLKPIAADWIDVARDRTIAQLQNFLAGHVHAAPVNREDCTWCDFKKACRIEQEVAEVDPEEIEIVKIGVAGAN